MSLKIVFLGTPEFATTSLRAIHESNHQIVGVVTAPDKPAGRGQQVQMSDVKKYALAHQLNLFQPEKLRNEIFLNDLKKLNADLFVVVAFRMLPEVVWNMPPMGTINLHGSRLPNYRGAAPIQWAIMNGEVNTGCTVFQLTHDIDTGDILSSNEIAIGPNETAGELYLRMMHEGAALLVQTLNELELGQITPIKQQIYLNASTKHAPKLEKEHGKINFNNSPEKIHNQVRGVTPFPGAFTLVQNKILKIFKGKPLLDTHTHVLGSFITDNKSYLRIAVQGGYYDLNELQLEGKKRMGVEEFLRGNGNLFS
jgi:methionyl-tRNA formyltransferase